MGKKALLEVVLIEILYFLNVLLLGDTLLFLWIFFCSDIKIDIKV